MELRIPESLKVEHTDLHVELRKACTEAGRLGQLARMIGALMEPHFVNEEKYALPPLSLLPKLAQGIVTSDMTDVLPLTASLQKSLDRMLHEHKAIVNALTEFTEAARKENKPERLKFAERLILHARLEEEVIYPTAILIGEYVKLKSETDK